jgi:hypothetical protein
VVVIVGREERGRRRGTSWFNYNGVIRALPRLVYTHKLSGLILKPIKSDE